MPAPRRETKSGHLHSSFKTRHATSIDTSREGTTLLIVLIPRGEFDVELILGYEEVEPARAPHARTGTTFHFCAGCSCAPGLFDNSREGVWATCTPWPPLVRQNDSVRAARTPSLGFSQRAAYTMRGTKKMSLRLPPNLEEHARERAGQGPVFELLPQATERLCRLCSVRELKLGRVVGRGMYVAL